jgi:hypothetical protein
MDFGDHLVQGLVGRAYLIRGNPERPTFVGIEKEKTNRDRDSGEDEGAYPKDESSKTFSHHKNASKKQGSI